MTDMKMNRSRSKKQGVEKNELDRVGVDDGRPKKPWNGRGQAAKRAEQNLGGCWGLAKPLELGRVCLRYWEGQPTGTGGDTGSDCYCTLSRLLAHLVGHSRYSKCDGFYQKGWSGETQRPSLSKCLSGEEEVREIVSCWGSIHGAVVLAVINFLALSSLCASSL